MQFTRLDCEVESHNFQLRTICVFPFIFGPTYRLARLVTLVVVTIDTAQEKVSRSS